MDVTFTKKKGRPKGRKDGPRREGAPKRGRPTKKVDNGGNNVDGDDSMDGACRFIFVVVLLWILRILSFTTDHQFISEWNDNEFTDNVLQKISELETQALRVNPVNEGRLRNFWIQRINFIFVSSELSTTTSVPTIPTRTDFDQADKSANGSNQSNTAESTCINEAAQPAQERVTLQDLREAAKASQTCMCSFHANFISLIPYSTLFHNARNI